MAHYAAVGLRRLTTYDGSQCDFAEREGQHCQESRARASEGRPQELRQRALYAVVAIIPRRKQKPPCDVRREFNDQADLCMIQR